MTSSRPQADFAAALDELGIAKEDLHLQIGYNTDANNENKIEYLQQQWKDAFGIDVEAVGLEWGTYLDRLATDPFDIFRLGWGADFPHPHNFLYDLAGCNSGNNNTGYCNEESDALMAEAAVTPNLENQIPLYNQAQEMIMPDTPCSPCAFGPGSRCQAVGPEPGGHVAGQQHRRELLPWITIAPH